MNANLEQRICLKFCVANGISCVQSLKMLTKCYGDSVLSKSQTYEWYKAFKTGREFVVDKPRSGRPSTSLNEENIEKVKELMLVNRTLSLREMARTLDLSHVSVKAIMTLLHAEAQDQSTHPCDEPTCDQVFANRRHMRAHWELEHTPPLERRFLCDRCSLPLPDKRKLQLHMEWHKRNPNAKFGTLHATSGQQPTQMCRVQFCNRKYVTRNSLVLHYRKMHPGVSVPSRSEASTRHEVAGEEVVDGVAENGMDEEIDEITEVKDSIPDPGDND